MNFLGVNINALNCGIGYSLIILALGLEIDRQVHLHNKAIGAAGDSGIFILLVIVNVTGLWLGITLQKAIP